MKSLPFYLIALIVINTCSSQQDGGVLSTAVQQVSELTLEPSDDALTSLAGMASSDTNSGTSGATAGTTGTSGATSGTSGTSRTSTAKVGDESWPASNDTFEGEDTKEPPFAEPSGEPEVSFIPKLSAETTTANTQDPSTARMCNLCKCSSLDEHPFVIDCFDKNMEEMPLDVDWPQNSMISSIQVDLTENQFTEILPWPKLPIMNLILRRNRIRVIEKASFIQLEQLELLDLSENELTHEALTVHVFQGPFVSNQYEPIPLKTLLLGYNQIHSINKDAFDHLPELERLELNNNPLVVIDRPTEIALSSIRKLKILNLAQTQLETIPEGLLHSLRSLQVLILNGNQLTTVPVELQRAPNLAFLNLNDNPIKKLDSTSFQGLSSLQQLNISAMDRLESIEEKTFSPLHSLRELFCSFNPSLRKIHSKAFMGILKQDEEFTFRQFHFHDNGVSYIPRALLPWDQLDVVNVQGNPFICDCSSGWMIKALIPYLEDKWPDLTLNLICSGPEKYKGKAIASLENVRDIQNCTGPAELAETTPPTWKTSYSSGFNVSLMIISMFGILVVIGVVGVMALMAVRKRHLRQMYDKASGQIVHYVRTANPMSTSHRDDEDAIIYRDSVYSENA